MREHSSVPVSSPATRGWGGGAREERARAPRAEDEAGNREDRDTETSRRRRRRARVVCVSARVSV